MCGGSSTFGAREVEWSGTGRTVRVAEFVDAVGVVLMGEGPRGPESWRPPLDTERIVLYIRTVTRACGLPAPAVRERIREITRRIRRELRGLARVATAVASPIVAGARVIPRSLRGRLAPARGRFPDTARKEPFAAANALS